MAEGQDQQGWQPQPQGWGGPPGGQPPQQPPDGQGGFPGQAPQQGGPQDPQGQPGTPPPWTPPPFQQAPGQYPPGGQFPPGGQYPQGGFPQGVPPQGGQFPPGAPYGGFPGPGQPGGYPQPPRTGRKPLVALFAAIGAVIVVLAVVAIAVWPDGEEPARALTTPEKGAAAATHLGEVRALHFTGDFTSDSTPVTADFTVTHAGTAAGTLTVYGQAMDMMLLDGDMYVKAPNSFWVTQPEAGEQIAPDYADKWAKAPKSLRGFDVRAFLVPGALGQSLKQAAPTVVPTGQPTAQTVNGVSTLAFEGGNAQYLVTDKAPHRLTQVKTGGDDSFSFTVSEVDSAALGTLYDDLAGKVKDDLVGALDPYSPIGRDGLSTAKDCTDTKCDVAQTFVNDGAAAWVKYHAEVSTDKAGTKLIGECTRSVKIAKGKTTLKCSVVGAAWKKWVRSLDGGSGDFYSYGWVQVESVSGARAATIISELEKERG
ncbi:hypothetical protein GCM10022221_16860 [Actinocorallia aurea]